MTEVEDDDSFIEFLEERNEGGTSSSLPHLRSNCTTNSFTEPHFIKICDNCYCYVCDTRALECRSWPNHCRATDTGAMKVFWKKYKDDELDKVRVAEGRPKKKLKTILNFFQKADYSMVSQPRPAAPSVPTALLAAVMNECSAACSSSIRAVSPDTQGIEGSILEIKLQGIVEKGISATKVTKVYENMLWAVIVGPRCGHSGYEFSPDTPEDATGRHRRRFVHCTVCKSLSSTHSWAVPKYRECCSTSLSVHEKSAKHQYALKMAAAVAMDN